MRLAAEFGHLLHQSGPISQQALWVAFKGVWVFLGGISLLFQDGGRDEPSPCPSLGSLHPGPLHKALGSPLLPHPSSWAFSAASPALS